MRTCLRNARMPATVGVVAACLSWYLHALIWPRVVPERAPASSPVDLRLPRTRYEFNNGVRPSIRVDKSRTETSHMTSSRVGAPESLSVSTDSFYPCDANEWHGAIVPEDPRELGEGAESARCSLALACVDNHCGACRTDRDCVGGERCVLDHCLLGKNVGCTSRRDCESSKLCILQDQDSGGP